MGKRIVLVVGVLCLAGWAVEAKGDDAPDLVEVMKRADAAARRVRAVAYDAEYFGTDELATRVPHVEARVVGRQARVGFFAGFTGRENRNAENSLRLTGRYRFGDGILDTFDVGTDGRNVFSVKKEEKHVVVGRLADAGALINSYRPLFMLEFFHPTPYHDEITARSRKYEGVEEIGGEQCDVIYVKYQRSGYDARWYIARSDSLPRRVDRIIFRNRKPIGARVLIVRNLDTTPVIRPDEFTPPNPDGFDRRAFAQKRAGAPVRPGAMAPDFELKTPDGETVKLSSLRGKVVILDFWSTWCVPCKISMPQLQSIHEKYANQPVRVIGLSCWEKDTDPAKMMKAGGLTYQLLVKADKVAMDYGVENIPAVFVIDPKGVIRFSHTGFVPTLERKLDRAIKLSLKKAETE